MFLFVDLGEVDEVGSFHVELFIEDHFVDYQFAVNVRAVLRLHVKH